MGWFDDLKTTFAESRAETNNLASALGDLGNKFKTTERKGVAFIRNFGYGRLGIFRVLNNTITNLQTLGGVITGLKTTFSFAMPVFEAVGEKLGEIGGAVTSFKGFSGTKATGDDGAISEVIDGIGGALSTVFYPITKTVQAFGENGFQGLTEQIQKDGKIKNIMKIILLPLYITLFPTLKLALIVLKFLAGTFMASFYTIIATVILGLAAIGIFVASFWDGIKGFWDIFGPPFLEFGKQLFTFIGSIFNAIAGIFGFIFGTTSFEEMAFGILDIAIEALILVLDLAIKVAIPLILGIAAFAIAMLLSVIARVTKFFWEMGFVKGVLVLGALIVAFLYGGAIGVAIAVGAYVVVKWLWSRVTKFFDWFTWDKFKTRFFGALMSGLSDFIDRIGEMFDFMHTGGIASGGPTIVGERGPELLQLPRGARVHSNAATRKMVSKGGGSTIINNFTINARDTSDGEMRRIADKLSSMINNKINRSTSSRTMG